MGRSDLALPIHDANPHAAAAFAAVALPGRLADEPVVHDEGIGCGFARDAIHPQTGSSQG